MIVVVDYIESVINSMRETGTFTVLGGSSVDAPLYYFTVNGEFINEQLKNIDGNALTDGTYNYVGEAPYFWYGNRSQIERLIGTADNRANTDRKYPVFILEMPFTEELGEFNDNSLRVNPMRLLIATNTKESDFNKQRYNDVFKPILYPLLEGLKKALNGSDKVESYAILEKTDVPYYGDEKPTVKNDYWDYIEIKIDITLKKCSC